MLDGTTLARGQISPDGKAINLATAQKTPGVGPVTNGVDLVNLAQPMAPARDNTPYYVSAALALAALMGGVFWWVWHRPKAQPLKIRGKVSRRAISRKSQLARNFPRMACHGVTGIVKRSSTVPERSSSDQSRIPTAGTRKR